MVRPDPLRIAPAMYRLLYWLVLEPAPRRGHAPRLVRAACARSPPCPGVRGAARAHARPRAIPRFACTRSGASSPARSVSPPASTRTPRASTALLALGLRLRRGRHGHRARRSPAIPKPRLFRLAARSRARQSHGLQQRRRRRRRARGSRIAARRHRRHQHRQDQARRRGRALDDFARSAQTLAPLADYLVVNVSSPNTPGLRDLQAVDKLRPLLAAVRAACDLASPMRRVPLLVKIAPDLADADIDAVADLALELGLDGIIATNTTIARAGLGRPSRRSRSSAPAASPARRSRRARSTSCAGCARASARGSCSIAVGGIETADDAWARIRAGATLVQAYTGFIYGGPLWPRRAAARARRAGARRPASSRSSRRSARMPQSQALPTALPSTASASPRTAASPGRCRCSSGTPRCRASSAHTIPQQFIGGARLSRCRRDREDARALAGAGVALVARVADPAVHGFEHHVIVAAR